MIKEYCYTIRQINIEQLRGYTFNELCVSECNDNVYLQMLRDLDFSLIAIDNEDLSFEILAFQRCESYLMSINTNNPLFIKRFTVSKAIGFSIKDLYSDFSFRFMKPINDSYFLSNPCIQIKKEILEKYLQSK